MLATEITHWEEKGKLLLSRVVQFLLNVITFGWTLRSIFEDCQTQVQEGTQKGSLYLEAMAWHRKIRYQ